MRRLFGAVPDGPTPFDLGLIFESLARAGDGDGVGRVKEVLYH